MRIDLHLHSNASDGTLSPSALVWAAKAARLDIIALTDHDTAAGFAEAAAAAAATPVVIPGIEVSSTHGGADLHFLGYFIDPADAALAAYAREAAERRRDRMGGMLRRLEALGISVPFEDVLEAAGPEAGTVGRPHLARAMLQRGYVRTYGEAFERFLADGGPAFLPTELLTPRAAIDFIHAIGGVASWAHPPAETLLRELDRFAAWGLDGLECLRPRNSSAETRRLLDAAAAHDLLVTGGSDWHGGPIRLGAFAVDRAPIDAFLRRGGL